jgi:LPXTG-motif cell wall-anchored protein
MKNVTRRFAVLVLILLVIIFPGKSVLADNIENNNTVQTGNDANAAQDITVMPDVQITPTTPGGDIYIIPDEPVPAGPAELPNTGELPPELFYVAGAMLISIGSLARRK